MGNGLPVSPLYVYMFHNQTASFLKIYFFVWILTYLNILFIYTYIRITCPEANLPRQLNIIVIETMQYIAGWGGRGQSAVPLVVSSTHSNTSQTAGENYIYVRNQEINWGSQMLKEQSDQFIGKILKPNYFWKLIWVEEIMHSFNTCTIQII